MKASNLPFSVICELFRCVPHPSSDACNKDDGLAVGDDVQVGVSGGVSWLSGGLDVSLCVSLGVGLVAALPPPSCPPPSFLDS